MVLNDLLTDILGRIEESNPPVFWNLSDEVYVAMVDAMFESALLTGVVQQSNVLVTLAANTTYFDLQNYTSSGFGENAKGIPDGVIAAVRMCAPFTLRKTTLKSLDDMIPAWQQDPASNQITAWFPLGVSGFGIYPQLSVPSQVTMDFVLSPVNKVRPYDGTESIPMQDEFADLISLYAAAALRSKEGGVEAEEADTIFQAYMGKLKQLSLFQQRLGSLIYSSAFGGQNQANPRKVV